MKIKLIELTLNLSTKIEKFLMLLLFFPYSIIRKDAFFRFNKKLFPYKLSQYNRSFFNERTVEIPIIIDELNNFKNKKILEIGNVLQNYLSFDHDIVDKYEKSNGVINRDIVDFKTKKKYDLIVSISTIEHIGYDEKPRDFEKIIKAIDNMKSLLAPKGKILVTIPLGYNHYLDSFIKNKTITFNKIYFMKRISFENDWIQVKKDKIGFPEYDKKFYRADTVLIGYIC